MFARRFPIKASRQDITVSSVSHKIINVALYKYQKSFRVLTMMNSRRFENVYYDMYNINVIGNMGFTCLNHRLKFAILFAPYKLLDILWSHL